MVNINTTMLWQVFNFFVLMYLLKRYLYSPIKEILDKRAAHVNSEIDEAEKMREEAKELKAKYQNKLKEAHNEAQSIIDRAEDRANQKAKNIVKEAEKRAENIKQKKLAEIEKAKKETMAELRNKVASMTILATNRLIQEQLDEDKHQVMIDQFIDQLDAEKLGEIQ
ncbi:F0F1 ATP synthase subunit B [Halanaerobium sp. Z-7514]|uniref:ATP synthase subunit b n=1 Tax=Halanaerobium polyolivorans TaxID=2886943 RepID=A0AAW4X045_9FIRM|nr:F0F1 ATP synthase subunit B [Halanaerobium polyolivorans]MCC3144886.1 F0F1 ATP synthase subunit B [Halanaerobium polyolivorans]RQD78826.1 MAG: ATP synthase F0 subunit B [Halanaerobium sp. MSAO_Bac5]